MGSLGNSMDFCTCMLNQNLMPATCFKQVGAGTKKTEKKTKPPA